MSNPTAAPPCYRHPDRHSSVVCAHCDRPICTDCMMPAAVGWQCPECTSAGAKKTRVIRPLANRSRTGVVGSTNPTPMVIGLVAVNVVVFVVSGFGKTSVIARYGDWPIAVHDGHQYYRLFDSMFLHLNFVHILFNMMALLIIGPAVEVMLGRARFLAMYVIAGLGGSVLSYLLSPANSVGAGASGAIFGVMGAYVMLAWSRRQPMQQVVALIAINLVIGFTGNIDWRAHIGGLLTGALMALVYDRARQLRPIARDVAVTVAASGAVLGVFTLLVLGIAPGHVGIG